MELDALVFEMELYERMQRPIARDVIAQTIQRRFPESEIARTLERRIEHIQ